MAWVVLMTMDYQLITAKDLENRRITLLGRLEKDGEEALDASNDVDDVALVKEEYNDIVERQIERKRGPLEDPLDVLPMELWVQIFQYFIYSSSTSKPVNATLRLTLTSKKWRDAILRTPELWSKITIDYGASDVMDRIQTALYLSGTSPLTLLIEHPTCDWHAVLSILLPHKDRIRGIVMQRSSSRAKADANFSIAKVIISFGELPALQHLDVRTGHSLGKAKADIFPEMTPSVCVVRGTYLPASILDHRNLKSIRAFACEYPLDVLAPYLFQLPKLRSIHMATRRKSPKPDQTTSRYRLPSDWPALPLQSITFQQPYQDHLTLLISKSTDLSTLKVSVTWEHLSEILGTLSSLPCLEKLQLVIRDLKDPSIISSVSTSFNQPMSMREIDLTFEGSSVGMTEEAELNNYRSLFYVFEKCATAVRGLFINELQDVYLAANYIASLPNLEELRLVNKGPQSEAYFPPLSLGSLQVLQLGLKVNVMSQILSTLNAPLSRLKVYCDGTIPALPGADVQLEEARYIHLRSIRWGSDVLSWHFTSLQSLVSISFKDTSQVTPSDLCVYITYRPYDLPALQDITFENPPEWDCVLLMLERRNFLPVSNVCRIKSLSFPSRTPVYLRKPITDLLRGQFTTRPSNREVSLIGIGEVYCDNTM